MFISVIHTNNNNMKAGENMGINVIQSSHSIYYILAFGLAFFIALTTTPLSKKIAFKVGAVDHPKDRGMHKKTMPRAGGISIVFGFMCTILIVAPFIEEFQFKEVSALLIGGLIIATLGFFDDIRDLNAKFKFAIQILVAIMVVVLGTRIEVLTWPFSDSGAIVLGYWPSFLLTIIWIVGITNAVNFLDGLDGLAAGISSISALCLMFISILSAPPNIVAIVLTATLAGSSLGFLPHNFNPAKIFMGDTGSTFLGFTLAVVSIQGLIKSYTAITLFIAVLVLALPIFDTAFAIIRRLLNGKPIMQADRGHLHHRLIDRGYSQKKAVLTLYCISGGFGIIGILYAKQDVVSAIMLLVVIIFIMSYSSYKFKKASKKS